MTHGATDLPEAEQGLPPCGIALSEGLGPNVENEMTFDEWWDTTKTESTPDTYKGWENSCRQAWAVSGLAEQRRWEEALRKTWQMVDPLNPAGSPGSYARGQDSGIVAALKTLRENLGA